MVAPGSATENSCSCARTGSSSDTSPAACACSSSVVVYSLLSEPSWKSVSGVTSTPVAVLATPQVATVVWSPDSTPHTAPGTPCLVPSSARRSSSRRA